MTHYYLNPKKSKFDVLFEQIMSETGLENLAPHKLLIETNLYAGKSFKFIMEDIKKPSYVTTIHGESFLLEEAVGLPKQYLIDEGIFSSVKEKVTGIISKITSGLKEVLTKGWDIIREFLHSVLAIGLVKKVRESLKLDAIVTKERFASLFKGQLVEESVLIAEAAKPALTVAERKLTDPKKIKAAIKKYSDYIAGKRADVFKKDGVTPLSKDTAKKRKYELNAMLKKLSAGTEEPGAEASTQTTSVDNVKQTSTIAVNNGSVSASSEGGEKPAPAEKKEAKKKVPVAAKVDEEAFKAETEKVVAEAEAAASAQTGGKEGEEQEDEEKKEGFLDKISNKIVGWFKNLWSSIGSNVVKGWIKAIVCVMILLVVGSIVISTMTAASGFAGVTMAGVGLFFSGQRIVATAKAGMKSWESGTGWSQFYLTLASTVLTVCGFKMIAMALAAATPMVKAAAGAAKKAVVG